MDQELFAWVEVAPGKRRRVKINPEDIQIDVPAVRRSQANGASAAHDTAQTFPKEATHVEERDDGTYAVFNDGTDQKIVSPPVRTGLLPQPPEPVPANVKRMEPKPTDISEVTKMPDAVAPPTEGFRPLPRKLQRALEALPDYWLLVRMQGQTMEVEAIHYDNNLNPHNVSNTLVNAGITARIQENRTIEGLYGTIGQLQEKVTELTQLLGKKG